MLSHIVHEADTLVIGGGIVATRAAISANEAGARVVIVDKGIQGRSGNAPVAYSVVAGVMNPPDSSDMFFKDVIRGGEHVNNQRLVEALVNDVINGKILEIEKYGIVFDRAVDDKLYINQMGGYTYPRTIVGFHAAAMIKALTSEVLRRGIKIIPEVMITSLLIYDGAVVGAAGIDIKSGGFIVFRAKSTVLASGGAGQIYGPGNLLGYTTNHLQNAGDGYSMSYRAGAELIDMEFVQFMPCSFAYPKGLRGILIGEPAAYGAKLYNAKRERFMSRYDPEQMENTRKDILTRAIALEIREGRGTSHGGVWMDFTHIKEEDRFYLTPHLPFDDIGIDPKEEWVEVAPSVHYFMGGVKINERCESGIPGLYAAGEVAGGVHGANRLAGCGIADSIVFGARAGQCAAERALSIEKPGIDWNQVLEERKRVFGLLKRETPRPMTPLKIKRRIQALMWEGVGAIRSEKGLTKALEELQRIKREDIPNMQLRSDTLRYNFEWIEAIEVFNMLDVAEMIAQAALLRKESRGSHFREDYPDMDNKNWLKNIVIKQEAGEMKLKEVPIATTSLKREV